MNKASKEPSKLHECFETDNSFKERVQGILFETWDKLLPYWQAHVRKKIRGGTKRNPSPKQGKRRNIGLGFHPARRRRWISFQGHVTQLPRYDHMSASIRTRQETRDVCCTVCVLTTLLTRLKWRWWLIEKRYREVFELMWHFLWSRKGAWNGIIKPFQSSVGILVVAIKQSTLLESVNTKQRVNLSTAKTRWGSSWVGRAPKTEAHLILALPSGSPKSHLDLSLILCTLFETNKATTKRLSLWRWRTVRRRKRMSSIEWLHPILWKRHEELSKML